MKQISSKLFFITITILIIFLNIYTINFLYSRKKDENNTNVIIKEVNDIINNNVIDETEDGKTEEISSSNEENDKWDKLKNINSDIKGWIKVTGTNIDYPFVQTIDNKYYLTHSLNKENNSSGWVFLDYRNNIDVLDKNTILYGHNRLTGTMFGTLKNVLTDDFKNSNDYRIYIYTEKYEAVFIIFSAYTISKESYYLKTNFNSVDEYSIFLNTLLERSLYDYGNNVTSNDRILTLSTCSGKSDRMVVHAKLYFWQEI